MQEGDVVSCEPQTQHLLKWSFDSTVNYKSPMSLHARGRGARGHPPACRVEDHRGNLLRGHGAPNTLPIIMLRHHPELALSPSPVQCKEQ